MKARPEAVRWLEAYYQAVDGMRVDQLGEFLHERCEVQYPGGRVVSGREQIIGGMQAALEALAAINHQLQGAWEEEQGLIFELQVTYTRRDGHKIVRPGAGIFVFEDGKIRQQRLFVDASGVWG